ncbi:MAG: hypothetical protein ACE5IO_02670 [Thermoplasmata archaeon]
MYDKRVGERDWDYLERKLPEVYTALYAIEGFSEALKELFDDGTFYWGSDSVADLTIKVMIGLLQLKIEDLQRTIAEIEKKHEVIREKQVEWHLFARERGRVLFENGVGEIARVPLGILDIIANNKAFDGKIISAGKDVRYVRGNKTVCAIPKSLVNCLSGRKAITEGVGKRGE